MEQVDQFKYLRSVTSADGYCGTKMQMQMGKQLSMDKKKHVAATYVGNVSIIRGFSNLRVRQSTPTVRVRIKR